MFDATVQQDGLINTPCYVETNGSDSEAFRAFDLKQGFANYLVDAEGVIVAKNVTPAELASYLKK